MCSVEALNMWKSVPKLTYWVNFYQNFNIDKMKEKTLMSNILCWTSIIDVIMNAF